MSVGGDHSARGTYASAAGAAPRVAGGGAREGCSDYHSVRAVPVPESGNGDTADAAPPAHAPEQRRPLEAPEPGEVHKTGAGQQSGAVQQSEAERESVEVQESGATRQQPLVPAARAVHDDELAARAAGIDDPAFRDYVRSRSRALLRTAYVLTGNVADAEDLVQSALAKTYVAWDRIEDRGALDGYVRRAIVNTHISWWRRRRLEEYPTDVIPDQAVVDHSVTSELQETVRRAIDRLPQRMRAAVMLRYYDDMTEAEVAEVLGVSLGTVKSTVSRAVAKLRVDAELQPE